MSPSPSLPFHGYSGLVYVLGGVDAGGAYLNDTYCPFKRPTDCDAELIEAGPPGFGECMSHMDDFDWQTARSDQESVSRSVDSRGAGYVSMLSLVSR